MAVQSASEPSRRWKAQTLGQWWNKHHGSHDFGDSCFWNFHHRLATFLSRDKISLEDRLDWYQGLNSQSQKFVFQSLALIKRAVRTVAKVLIG